jgi:hypothetical protein
MARPFSVDLPVEYHQQDTACYCGPTVAMMILNYLDPNREFVPEATLWPPLHNHFDPTWHTTPQGLEFGLNYYRPEGYNGFFSVQTAATVCAGSETLVQALYANPAVPAAALTGVCSHWVVVRGFNTDVEPAPGSTYNILGFWVNDPTPTPSGHPPPHLADDSCGTTPQRGSKQADEYLCWDDWSSFRHFNSCPDACGNARFITVCGNSRARTGTLRLGSPARARFFGGRDYRTDAFIPPGIVQKIVRGGFELHGLAHGALDGVNPGEPRLVQRLDAVDEYYQLVPLERGGTVAFARVDALRGTFLGVSGASADALESHVLSATEDVERALVGRIADDCSNYASVLREGSFTVHPTLVWRPCRESTSPYDPFHQIDAAGRVYYVDGRNRIYSSLTDLRPGD